MAVSQINLTFFADYRCTIISRTYYKFASHFLPDLVCDQITNAEPMTLVIKKIVVNASIIPSYFQ